MPADREETGLRRLEAAALALVALVSIAAGALHLSGASAVLSFAALAVALAGLAWTVSFATEQLGERFGPAVTGVLQSTLGNLPEFFVVLFALSAGEIVVAQTSLVGSVLANALLVLGLSIAAGAFRSEDGVMRFGRRLPSDTATLLLVSVFIIALVGVSVAADDRAAHHVKAISVIGALCLLAVYLTWLVPYLRADAGPVRGRARLGLAPALAILLAAGVGAAFVSDWFVAELRPTIDRLGISAAFAGLVIVAIAGNAVENVVGITLAWKRQPDLAISVIKNSVSQVAVFLFPLLVLCSLFFAHSLTFSLAPVFIVALLLTAIAVWQITGDGEATLFEGVALVALYVILAAVTLYE
ncbi:MAG: sodium:proton exchanger [Gaiellaceae bacterium]